MDDTLVEKIYEAAVLPDRWPGLLDLIVARHDAKGALLMANLPNGVAWLGTEATTPVFEAFLREGWMAHNDRVPRLIARRHAGFLTDGDFYSDEEMLSLPMYAEFLRPHGMNAAAATAVTGATGDGLVLSIEGFEDQSLARAAVPDLDALRPHLARAAMLSGQLNLQRARASVDALGMIGAPAAVVGRSRRLISTNLRFERLMPSLADDGPSGLRLRDSSADLLFRSALDSSGTGQGGSSIPIRGAELEPARVLHIVPLRRSALDVFAHGLALVVVSEPQLKASDPSLIQALFDLTPAEARLAAALAEGATLASAADALGVTQHTVRSQLKSVFLKTGVERQQQLVGLLVSLNACAPL